jgi:hypothetical protein
MVLIATTSCGQGSVNVAPPPSKDWRTAPATSREALSARPLRLLKLSRGTRCPRTTAADTQYGMAAGLRPIRAVITPDSNPGVLGTGLRDGRYFGKVLWVIDGQYSGLVLVRGARVDGTGDLMFGDAPPLSTELTMSAKGSSAVDTGMPSTVSVSQPGCYEFQVDAATFTSFIVFEVT